MNPPKYRSPKPFEMQERIWPSREITRAPILCSVDLRDGNQAFVNPMNADTKIKYFEMLVRMGFKEIEVSYPAASQEDFMFVRRLIEENRIPDDVTIGVLTAMRADLINRTLDAVKGAKNVIIHGYIASSELHNRFVFGKSPAEVRDIAVDGTRTIIAAAERTGMRIRYEFSPEEFSDSDLPTVIELCKAVKEAWGPCAKGDFIVNLPMTVERRPPNQFADMIEIFTRQYPYMNETIISVHTHNDMGCGIAAAELAVLAGADRVEGTLCGHGERTGNMDIMVFALNLHARGIETGIDFSNLPSIMEFVQEVSGIDIAPRHPYAGELVFTAFSGTHQDAIRKGLSMRKEIGDHFTQGWKMPYIHIDPVDIGRNYDGLIRINSQSGKGGVAFILEHYFGVVLPKAMHPAVGEAVQAYADKRGGEVSNDEIYRIFIENFAEVAGPVEVKDVFLNRPFSRDSDVTGIELEFSINGKTHALSGSGNGPIAAAVDALRRCPEMPNCEVAGYSEHALGSGAEARAIAYLALSFDDTKEIVYGVGISPSINIAAIRAIGAALNRKMK